MADPYVYPGTDVLINKLGITDVYALRRFEIEATAQRLTEDLPDITLGPQGYCELHRHIFQDVYAWAGEVRTVDISKGGDLFCRAAFIESALVARFAAIQSLQRSGTNADAFTREMAEHLSELNAIHPFREGNGRTNRAFLKVVGAMCGHPMDLTRIDPAAWNRASRDSFRTGSTRGFHRIVASCLGTRS